MFHKMKVTGPRCAEFITEPLQAIRELNPALDSMIHSTEQMNKIVCESAKLPWKKRRKMASSAVAMHDAHLQRLKALKSDYGYAYDPFVQALAQHPPIPQDEPPPPVEEEDESSLGSRAGMERVMEVIPKQFRSKVAILGNYLKAHPNLIRFTPTGHPIVSGMQIPNANIVDVIRSLYMWPRSQPLPRGAKEVVEALHSIGIPTTLLSNSAVRTMYHSLHEMGEQSHTETEEQEEEEEEEEQEMSTPMKTPLQST